MPTALPLRALHPPPPLPWPGPTLFEWCLLALALLLAGLALLRLRRQLRRRRWRRALREELSALQALASSQPGAATLGCLTLIRRILLLHHPRERIASVTGQAWLEALDALSGSDWFTHGSGSALAVAGHAQPAEPTTVRLALEAAHRIVDASLLRQPDPPDA